MDLGYIAEPLRQLAVRVEDLHLDPNNARDHSDDNLDHIKSSLAKFGQRKPIVVQKKDSGMIIRAGNGTFQAAKEMKWTHIAAVVLEEDDISATAYALADNKVASQSWNEANLKLAVNNLIDTDYNMIDFGFNPEELHDLVDLPEMPDNNTTGSDVSKAASESNQGDSEEDNSSPAEVENVNVEYIVVVVCKNESEQSEVFSELIDRGLECKLMS